MAHKAMIDGKAYEISGGKTMVDGKVYSVSGGKTMVDGKAYDVAFGSGNPVITITGSGKQSSAQGAMVKIGSSQYTSAAVVEVEQGTSITMTVGARGSGTTAQIYVDGTSVAKISGGTSTTQTNIKNYTYTVNGDIDIQLQLNYSSSSKFYGTIRVTTK